MRTLQLALLPPPVCRRFVLELRQFRQAASRDSCFSSWVFGEIVPVLGGSCPARPVRFPELLHPSELLPLAPLVSVSQVRPSLLLWSPLAWALLLALLAALWHPRPHNFMVMAAKADAGFDIPDQLFLVSQDQVQVSIAFVGPTWQLA